MKFARNEGKLWRYLLLFSIITFIFSFVGTQQIYSYLLLILTILYGIKYVVRIKISLCDILTIVSMIMLKIVIELSSMFIFYGIFGFNQFITTIIFEIGKILFITITKENIFNYNKKIKIMWDKNNFYIRYFFSIFAITYVIISTISLLWLIMK
jgi:hypothetical protein